MKEKEIMAKLEELEAGLDRSSDTLENDHDVPVHKTKAEDGATVIYEYGDKDNSKSADEETNLRIAYDRKPAGEYSARADLQTNRHNTEIAGGEKPFEALYLTEEGTWSIDAADGKELEQNDLDKILAYTFQSYLLK